MTRAAAQAERIGLEHTAEFCRILRSVPLAGKSYLACLAELMDGLATRSDASAVCAPPRAAPRPRVARPDALRAARQLPEEAKEFVRGFIKSQRVWIKTMERMGVAA